MIKQILIVLIGVLLIGRVYASDEGSAIKQMFDEQGGDQPLFTIEGKKVIPQEVPFDVNNIFFDDYQVADLGQDRGGGDVCENKIKEIGKDLYTWIYKDGGRDLDLDEISYDDYKNNMLQAINQAKAINCISGERSEQILKVNGIEKTCVFDKRMSSITCDESKFMSKNIDDQYRLIHHEFAGLAGLENPNQENSNYKLSNQISYYLETITVKKLVIKNRVRPGENKAKITFFAESGIKVEEILNIKNRVNHIIEKIENSGFYLNYSYDDKKKEYKQFNGIINIDLSPKSGPIKDCSSFGDYCSMFTLPIEGLDFTDLESFLIREFYSHKNMHDANLRLGYAGKITVDIYLDLKLRLNEIFKKFIDLGFTYNRGQPNYYIKSSGSADICSNIKTTEPNKFVRGGPITDIEINVRKVVDKSDKYSDYVKVIHACITDEELEVEFISNFHLISK